MPTEDLHHLVALGRWALACAGALVAGVAAARAAWATRGSTAVPAALWALAGCVGLAIDCGSRAGGIVGQPSAAASLRLITAALAVCPAMSLLGAKRPQHGVWQLIVAALAVILVLPALAGSLVRPGSVPDMHLLGRLFLVVLVAVGWMNFVATRGGLAATLVAVGQGLIVRGFIPLFDTETAFPPSAAVAAVAASATDACAAWLVACGGLLAWIGSARARRRPAVAATFAAAVDPPFLALRDTLGAAWALRIAERFDQIATDRGWPCRLGFRGMRPIDAQRQGPWQHDAERALGALLRRFVSEDWLSRHVDSAIGMGKLARRRGPR